MTNPQNDRGLKEMEEEWAEEDSKKLMLRLPQPEKGVATIWVEYRDENGRLVKRQPYHAGDLEPIPRKCDP